MYSSGTPRCPGSAQFAGAGVSTPVPKVKEGEILVKQTYWDYDEFMNPEVSCPQKKSYYKVMSKDEFCTKQELCKDLEQKRNCILKQLGRTGDDAAIGKYQRCIESDTDSSEEQSSTSCSDNSSQEMPSQQAALRSPNFNGPPPPLPQLRDRMEAMRMGRPQCPQSNSLTGPPTPRPRSLPAPTSSQSPIRSPASEQRMPGCRPPGNQMSPAKDYSTPVCPSKQPQPRRLLQNTGQYPMPRRPGGQAGTRLDLQPCTSRPNASANAERTPSGQLRQYGLPPEARSMQQIPTRTCPPQQNSRLPPQQSMRMPQQLRSAQLQGQRSNNQQCSKPPASSADQACPKMPSKPDGCEETDTSNSSSSESSDCQAFLPSQCPAAESQRQQALQPAQKISSIPPARPRQTARAETRNGGCTMTQRPLIGQQQQLNASSSQGQMRAPMRGLSPYPGTPQSTGSRLLPQPSSVPLVPQKVANYPPPRSPARSPIRSPQPPAPFECNEGMLWDEQPPHDLYDNEDNSGGCQCFGDCADCGCNENAGEWGEDFVNCPNDPMIFDEQMPNMCAGDDDVNLESDAGSQRPDPKVQIIIQIPQVSPEKNSTRSNYSSVESQYTYRQAGDFQRYGNNQRYDFNNSEADPCGPVEDTEMCRC